MYTALQMLLNINILIRFAYKSYISIQIDIQYRHQVDNERYLRSVHLYLRRSRQTVWPYQNPFSDMPRVVRYHWNPVKRYTCAA